MTESSLTLNQESARYPLSFTQEWFITLDQGDDGGSFGPRFLIVCAMRVAGPVDLAVLQGSLDDVVARHELLRTLVVRDADPPYQKILPPCPVPLEVKDLPPAAGTSRDRVVRGLIDEAKAGSVSAREVPLLRARLSRFDERDSVLVLTVHHSVCDVWSMDVIMRDLGAFYAARRSGGPAKLPPVRQYREYAEWQRANASSTAEDGPRNYWLEKLHGAREFNMPNDHRHPDSYSVPFSLYSHVIEADIMTAASNLATASRTTLFTVLLSAYYVLAHQITGATDLAIRAFTAGRDEEQFQETMGLFLNVVPFRTSLDGCSSFRDIIARAKDTFIDAITHELPVNVIEQALPDFTKPREDRRTSEFIISGSVSRGGEDVIYPIAEGARHISGREEEESANHDIPSGTVWSVSVEADGKLHGGIIFNREEFDESTVKGWSSSLLRILTGAVGDPDRDWKTL